MQKIFLALVLALSLSATAAYAGVEDIALAHMKDNAEMDAAEIIEMRSALAKTFIQSGAEITPETFRKVCGAVGKRVAEISKKEGVTIRHAAIKYRNPKNKATDSEAALMKRFEEDKLKQVWDSVEKDGAGYLRLTRPIFVEKACLACHGEKDSRPAFIVKKYPEDKAYGFKTGDLRGIISILIPQ